MPGDSDDSEPLEAWDPTGLSALVVDDEATLADLTADVLRCAGLVVQVAYGGQDGLEAYKNVANPPDILVIDATMPELDGRGLIRAIREIEPAARVILVSGYDASEEDTLSISGLQWFLKKPYTSSELLHCVRIAVNSKSKRAAAG
jgi:DNA-binding response OmpR family regulator